jgi:hypothetical protein
VGKLSVVVEGTFMRMRDFLLLRNIAGCVCRCQRAKWYNTCYTRILKQIVHVSATVFQRINKFYLQTVYREHTVESLVHLFNHWKY